MQIRTIAPLLLAVPLTASFGVGPLPCQGPAPSRPATEAPPQRRLTGAEAQRVEGLLAQVSQLEKASRFADAFTTYQEILAIRRRVQGADHWETVNEKWNLAALKKVSALPAEKRAGWRQAMRADQEADSLDQKAQYAKALPLRQERLKWCRQVLGEDHTDTAQSYNNLAFNLYSQGKYAQAGPLYQKSLDIFRKALGEEHPSTAEGYNNLAANLHNQGK